MSVKCKNCKNFKDDWCEKVVDSPYPDLERDCNHFVQATNADRIRAMSDEELADEFFKFGDNAYSMGVYKKSGCLDTREEILKWLQEPVVQNDTDCGCSNCANLGNNSICSKCLWDSKWQPGTEES